MADTTLNELLSCSDFLYIQKKINEPNIFHILSNTGYEIRHSNFIAWLLDAKESHCCGTLFSAELVAKLAAVNNPKAEWKILREKHNIDLILTSPEETVVIENKTYSKDAPNQLKKYRELIINHPKYKRACFVYLNLKGEAPKDFQERQFWKLCSYSEVIFTLKKLCEEKKDEIDKNHSKTRVLVEDYINAVEIKHLKSGAINKKAKNLIAKEPNLFTSIFSESKTISGLSHSQIKSLHFIKDNSNFQRGKGFFRKGGLFREAFEKALQKNNFKFDENQNTTYFSFASENMLKKIPREELPFRFGFRFFEKRRVLHFGAGIGPENHQNCHIRIKVVNNLDQIQRDFGKNAVRARGFKHIGLFTKNIPFNPLDIDETELEHKIEKLITDSVAPDVLRIEGIMQKIMLK